jgi:uncharacterized protein YaiL (DUF2058 family)
MSDSLQDQLRALGLARQSPERNKPRRKSKPAPNRPAAGKSAGGEMPLGKAYALREKEEQKNADKARRRKLAEDRKRREINKKIRAIVKDKRLNVEDAEVARNFMYRERIRKIYVTADQNKALTRGELGLAYLSGGYHVLDRETLGQVRSIAADHVVDLEASSEDEEEFPVPDDLQW